MQSNCYLSAISQVGRQNVTRIIRQNIIGKNILPTWYTEYYDVTFINLLGQVS